MNINKELLATRITIIMVRENYTFLNTISDFKNKLKEYFNVNYTDDEIETTIHDLEEAYLFHEYEKEKQIIEHEEDF